MTRAEVQVDLQLPLTSLLNQRKGTSSNRTKTELTMATDDSELLVPFPLDEAAAVAGADATAAAPSPDASVAAASAQTLPPLTEILHDTEHFEQYLSSDGKKRVKCLWCQHVMPLHATKLLHHAARIANKGVKICSGLVPKPHKDRYANLYEKKLRGANRKSGELIQQMGMMC